MKLVINIPDKYYDLLPEIMNGSISCNVILDCVKNGQLLPKGHGRLIDENEIMHILDEVGGDFDTPREAVVPIDYITDMVADIPTIIEADTACLNPEKLNEVKQDFKQDLNKSDDCMFGDYMSPIV